MSQCRVCLKCARNMIPFDEKNMMYFNLLTNLNLELSADDPQLLCKHCFKTLQLFIEFREKSIAANAVFSDLIPIESIKHENECEPIISETEVKLEEKADEEAINIFEYDIANDYDDFHGADDNEFNDDNLMYELFKTESKAEETVVTSQDVNEPKEDTGITHARNTKYVRNEAPNESNSSCKTIQKANRKKKTVKNPKDIKQKCKDIETQKCEGKSVVYDMISETSLPCGLCTKSFENNTQLDAHLSTHKEYNSCNICGEPFQDWQELMSHRLNHLPGKRIPCHLCPKKFQSPIYMEHHLRNNHHTEGERKELRCKICDRCYMSPRRLHCHNLDMHNLKNKEYYCDHCNKLCRTRSIMMVHLAMHMDARPFRCDLCDSTFKHSNSLRAHKIARHNPDRVYCMTCHYVFASAAQRNAHVCKYDEAICPVCGKICTSTKALKRHIIIHDKSKWYKCERCPASYRSRLGLVIHCDKHDGVPRYTCQFCGAKFYFPSALTKHRRIHTGEKPYVCKVCQKSFTGNHNLKVHMRVHGKFLIKKQEPKTELGFLQDVASRLT